MNASGPKECCLREENLRMLREYPPRGYLARCGVCGRTHLSARMLFDDMCIEPMDYHLWREVDADEAVRALAPRNADGELTGADAALRTMPQAAAKDPADYIMERKPYYARNTRAGGNFRRVE